MPDNKNQRKEKPTFKSFVPPPTEEDLKWANESEEKALEPTRGLVRSLIKDNQVWRLDYLVKKSPEKIDLRKTSYWDIFMCIDSNLESSILGEGINYKGRDNATLYVMEHFKTSLYNVDRSFHKSMDNRNVTALYVTLMDENCKESSKKSFLDIVIRREAIELLPAFFEVEILSVNDLFVKPLLLAVRSGDLGLVDSFVMNYGADIALDDYIAIREAVRIGADNIQRYLEEKADVKYVYGSSKEEARVEKNVKRIEATNDNNVQNTDLLSTKWRKINDNEVLEVSSSEDKLVMLTRLFNFAAHEVTQTQYITDYAPVSVVRDFDDIKEKSSLKEAFDALVKLKGNPPQDIFKHTTRVDLSR